MEASFVVAATNQTNRRTRTSHEAISAPTNERLQHSITTRPGDLRTNTTLKKMLMKRIDPLKKELAEIFFTSAILFHTCLQ